MRWRLPIIIFIIFISLSVQAQPGDPASGPPDSTPLTGIEILVGLGSLFGAKNIFDSRKKKKLD